MGLLLRDEVLRHLRDGSHLDHPLARGLLAVSTDEVHNLRHCLPLHHRDAVVAVLPHPLDNSGDRVRRYLRVCLPEDDTADGRLVDDHHYKVVCLPEGDTADGLLVDGHHCKAVCLPEGDTAGGLLGGGHHCKAVYLPEDDAAGGLLGGGHHCKAVYLPEDGRVRFSAARQGDKEPFLSVVGADVAGKSQQACSTGNRQGCRWLWAQAPCSVFGCHRWKKEQQVQMKRQPQLEIRQKWEQPPIGDSS
jgi:hypothetical protein